ncbi:tetratricopeptide repeat domain-containing protein [Diplodia corticola]|uniref:ER membrane protein complex subunit 2 n=1 Tax=Diplodia corticola TaxID=236234 RepID=A0A1J9RTB1_9PEZI|nr:tetratricopeptide repeat domain-containing protein [Diplodia corticola]OJD31108.1 tetratricopeptide repeat domain-containing protein [Diplodia corticola]
MSAADLVYPPPNLPPASALRLSQSAPRILSTSTTSSLPWPLSLLTSRETQETWASHENLLLSCLRTGDDKSARQCLDRLTARFGQDNQRVVALRFLYESAVADDKDLRRVLEDLERVLKEDPTSLPLRKRKVALLRSMGRTAEAITALVDLVDFSPTDAESWAELSDLYLSQSMYSQAIFSLEEVLVITPFAWNVHARMGELLYISATAANAVDGNVLRNLSEGMRRFCRSIELCDNYLRGYYGLKLTTKKLLELLPKASNKQAVSDTAGDIAPPSVATVEKLRELATAKLAEIVRRSGSGEAGWDYDQSELIAARELLDRDTQAVPK